MVKKFVSLYLAAALVCPGAALAAGEEEDSSEAYDVTSIKAGEVAPFDGILMTYEAASKIAVDKKFEDASCELRISYELHIQGERHQLQIDYSKAS